MKKSVIISVCLVFIVSIICASAEKEEKSEKKIISASQIGSDIEIIGDLHIPIGKEVMISGVKEANGPIQDHFWVDEIDGAKIDGVIGIQIPGIAKWKDGTRATLQGCEEGTIAFLYLEQTNYGPNDPRWKGPYQKVFLSFSVSRVVSPKNLKIDEKK